MLKIFAATLLATLTAAPAFADRGDWGDRRHYRHHDWHRPRTVVSLNFGDAPYYHRRHHHFYRPTPVYYSQPVYYPQPQPQVIYINDNARYERAEDGRFCREYTATAIVGGRNQQTYGTACLQPDGSWEIIS